MPRTLPMFWKELREARSVGIPESIVGKMGIGIEPTEKEKEMIKQYGKVYVELHVSDGARVRPHLRNLPGGRRLSIREPLEISEKYADLEEDYPSQWSSTRLDNLESSDDMDDDIAEIQSYVHDEFEGYPEDELIAIKGLAEDLTFELGIRISQTEEGYNRVNVEFQDEMDGAIIMINEKLGVIRQESYKELSRRLNVAKPYLEDEIYIKRMDDSLSQLQTAIKQSNEREVKRLTEYVEFLASEAEQLITG